MAIKRLADGRWYVDVEPVKGRRFRKTVKTKGEALRFEAHIRTTVTQYDWEPAKKDLRKLGELITLWFDLHGQNLKDGIKRLSKLNHLNNALKNPVAVKLSSELFASYRTKRLDAGITAKTLNNELGYLRAVYNELLSLNQIDYTNPLQHLKPLKLQEKSLTYLSSAQVVQLLNTIKSGCENPHVYPITLICLSTGARWSEAEGLTAEKLKHTLAHFDDTKNSRFRSVPISADLEKKLRNHWLKHGPFTPSLSSFRRALVRSKINLPRGQASHVLRHTFASHFVQLGGDILTLQKILGHSSLVMTMRYAHLAPDHLKQAVELNPLSSIDTLSTPD